MRAAYADPPYLGQAKKHYGSEQLCGEVNHEDLISKLNTYDAWALSLSSVSLQTILPICPNDVRIGAWVKPFCSFKPNVNPAYAWEPVIFRGGRKLGRNVPTIRDWISEVITLKKGVHGAKPQSFCFWMFAMLGLEHGDQLWDIYPGSGGVWVAWIKWVSQKQMHLSSKI